MIEIMSETEGSILVVKATEKLTAKDYEEAKEGGGKSLILTNDTISSSLSLTA